MDGSVAGRCNPRMFSIDINMNSVILSAKAIDEANVPFDPAFHQAIMTEKRDGVEPEMILEVLQKGYLLKDKVIRPAMVKVSE